jgi:hypothetical protein
VTIPTALLLAAVSAQATMAASSGPIDADGPVAFAAREIRAAAAPGRPPAVALVVRKDLGPQAYRIDRLPDGGWQVTGGDATGAMYGGLDVAEAIRLGTLDQLAGRARVPHVAQRGIKFNLPLDLRTPSYSDSSDAAQANIPVMWDRSFWREFLDDLARHRFNVLSLWSLHPFPSMVKVPEFPDVALDDVWRTRTTLGEDFSLDGNDMVKPAMLTDVQVVARLSIDEKIAFWRWVMQAARDRGIDVYVFTWNVFTWGADGKHGITRDMENPVTKAYFRASVREMVKTYPLLAGFGITAGEGMPAAMDATIKEKWLWDTYGEGVRDALKDDPSRVVRMIHRFHWTAQSDIVEAWKGYPGYPSTFDFSFKYSVAHMYSITDPPFIDPLIANLQPGLKTWLTVRNDDIYTFRFGDPDYVRDYVANMPPPSVSAGFYMGPDGYIWGRDFLERRPDTGDRPLVIRKQWYSFMLVGRLAYDPTLTNTHFERVLGARFPGTDAHAVFAMLQSSARTMPLVTRFFWGDIDLKWYPEASLSAPRHRGYYDVRAFVEGTTMPGAHVLSIREWRENLAARQPMRGATPLDIAAALEGTAAEALGRVGELRARHPRPERELRLTIDDSEALALLAQYYAAKIRGACAIALYDIGGDPDERTAAVRALTAALDHWKRYAAVRDGNYVPALYNRVGVVNVTALTAKVAGDVDIARAWRPGTVSREVPKDGTEKGFRK